MTHSPVQLQIYDPNNGDAELDILQLQALFRLGAFWAQDRSMGDLETAIAHSVPVVMAWDGDRLIGFSRATSDWVYRATIWDVVVHPDYRGMGIGRKLVQTVLGHPAVNRVERVYLMTTHQQHFYEQIGFQVNNTTTMVLYNQSQRLLDTASLGQELGALAATQS